MTITLKLEKVDPRDQHAIERLLLGVGEVYTSMGGETYKYSVED